MSRNATAFRALLVLGGIHGAAPGARADSDVPTTISARDQALSRSTSAASLAPAMPGGPPPLSSAGAPETRAVAAATAAAPVAGGPIVPAAAPPTPAPLEIPREASRRLAVPSVARASAPASAVVSDGEPVQEAPRRGLAWRWMLGLGASASALGLAIRRRLGPAGKD